MLSFLLLLFASALADDPGTSPSPTAETSQEEACEDGLETRIPKWSLPVYRQPDSRSNVRGRVLRGAAFHVLERVEGHGCGGKEGWGLVAGEGYICLDQTDPSSATPLPLPILVTFDHPEPEEYLDYVETGDYPRESLAEADALVPFVYAKRWRGWTGSTWPSLSAWNSGDRFSNELSAERKYHFVSAIETTRGTVLERSNGEVVPADKIFIYPVSRFHGRDLEEDPLEEGLLSAWVFGYEGGPVYASPEEAEEPVLILDYHRPLAVKAEAADATGHWWEIPDALGEGVPGFAHDEVAIRHWVPRPAPEQVEEGELWIDVDRGQQVLALRRGEDLVFVTMVSTGEGKYWRTRSGLYRAKDKSIYGDMVSRPDAKEPYHVEKVPWVMHFYPRYAIHGVFWHWGFGHAASHGCINMSPLDARYIFDRLHPYLPNGWHTVYETPNDPGMLIRVRLGPDEVIPDKRRPILDDRSASR